MKPYKIILFLLILLPFPRIDLLGCTTIIISAKASPDGRPLLWKQRDSDEEQSKLKYFHEGKFEFIGVVDVSDTLAENVWIGTNSAGFAIMNSASYNLNIPDTCKRKDREGILMKLALMYCTTLADFEKMLDTLTKPYGVEANFGVIDAEGGAAYYETGNFGYKKIDVNDPASSPLGYVIHTNFSFAGKKDLGGGYIRYMTAEKLFMLGSQTNDLSVEYILRNVSRNLQHSLTEVDLSQNLPRTDNDTRFVFFEDFIPRFITTSSVIIQGVRKGESPDFTTMWTVIGWPMASITIPVWVCGGYQLPEILTAGTHKNSRLCDWSLQLKQQCFPIKPGYGSRYILLNKLINQEENGILQKTLAIERRTLPEINSQLAKWRKQGINKIEIQSMYVSLNDLIKKEYLQEFNLQ